MSLLTLPVELLTIIIRKLDTPSVRNLYESCGHLRDVISTSAMVRKCQFSVNKLASVKSLNSDFFNNVAGNLKILNLSGVSDLDKPALLPALEKLQNLIDLDVSYTKIIMPDFLEIIKIIPTLKCLAINFNFDKYDQMDKKLLLDYQQSFKGLKNIHFVGNHYLLHKAVLHMLQKTELATLKFTLCRNNFKTYVVHEDVDGDIEMIKMTHCQIFFLEELRIIPLGNLHFFNLMDEKEYEVVLFQLCIPSLMHSTPFFKEFIEKHFDVDINDFSSIKLLMSFRQATIMFWDKRRTTFDDVFYSKLLFILKENLIYNFNSDTMQSAPLNFKRYCIEQDCPSLDSSYDSDFDFFYARKRRKLSYKSYKLNYDVTFEEKTDIYLRISFLDNLRPVTLGNCDFLKKLTHLILYGDIRYTATFFKKLFEFSDCLVTLEIIKKKGIVSSPLTYLKLAKIKNILLYIKGSHMFQIFNCLSECKTLENIHLVNVSHSSTYRNTSDVLPNPTELFRNCAGLYNFSCQSCDMYGEHRNEMMQKYTEVRSQLNIDGLNIAMFIFREQYVEDQYNPYLRVFDVVPLKPM